MASTHKTTIIALVLTGSAAVGVCVTAMLAFTGDAYIGMAGAFVFYTSLIAAAGSIPFWAWSRPSHQVTLIIVLGALAIGAMGYAGLLGFGELYQKGRVRNQIQKNELAEKQYLASRAFNFINVRYDADTNQLIRTSEASGQILNTAVVIPFNEAYLLILVDSSAYVFDGTSSQRVEFTGRVVENGTAVNAGQLTFRGKNYSINEIGTQRSEITRGKEKGGDEYGVNHKLVEAIAPAK
jgi:hypothetical protein